MIVGTEIACKLTPAALDLVGSLPSYNPIRIAEEIDALRDKSRVRDPGRSDATPVGSRAGGRGRHCLGSPNTISGDTNVDTTGTLVGAFNMGGILVPTTTVNGVPFTGIALSGTSVTSGNFTFTQTGGWNSGNVTSANAPFAALSASYRNLLSWGAGDFTSPAPITMSGLTVGAKYEFEWWSNDSNGLRSLTTATAVNSVTLTTNTAGLNGAVSCARPGRQIKRIATMGGSTLLVLAKGALADLAHEALLPVKVG